MREQASEKPSQVRMPTTAGGLIVTLVDHLSERGISCVYLRNYEKLPNEVGNDVDLLVPRGEREAVADLFREFAEELGWKELGRSLFGPLAQYFFHAESAETLHIDLFDRLEWHCLEIADAGAVLERRRWNGQVHVPDEADEVYLNILTRLIYQGTIREKHRKQAIASGVEPDALRERFVSHLGGDGGRLFDGLVAEDWAGSPDRQSDARRAAWREYGLQRPGSLCRGFSRYLRRVVGKILRPPGRLIVFEGADGVGKSTILSEIVPWCGTWCSGRTPYRFHWKPLTLESGEPKGTVAMDPRGEGVRSAPVCLVYLGWHLLSYWWAYFRRVYPKLVMGHAVVGDRYSFDLFLDKRRFRLDLPDWVCRCAAVCVPRPTVAICLLAEPEEIRRRKPELEIEEIDGYQARWTHFASSRAWATGVSAEGTIPATVFKVKQVILALLYELRKG